MSVTTMRPMKIVVALLALLGFVFPSASGGAVHSSTAWSARMSVPTHRPKANRIWPVRIVVRIASGRALSGTVIYHFLFGGQVVSTQSCRPRHPRTPCRFSRGVYRDVVRWPARSAGYRLTFQATVRTRYGTRNLNYWVQVRR